MYLLAEIFPFVRRIKIPFSRDQFMLLLAAFNLLVLGLGAFAPLGFTDGSTILTWWGKR